MSLTAVSLYLPGPPKQQTSASFLAKQLTPPPQKPSPEASLDILKLWAGNGLALAIALLTAGPIRNCMTHLVAGNAVDRNQLTRGIITRASSPTVLIQGPLAFGIPKYVSTQPLDPMQKVLSLLPIAVFESLAAHKAEIKDIRNVAMVKGPFPPFFTTFPFLVARNLSPMVGVVLVPSSQKFLRERTTLSNDNARRAGIAMGSLSGGLLSALPHASMVQSALKTSSKSISLRQFSVLAALRAVYSTALGTVGLGTLERFGDLHKSP